MKKFILLSLILILSLQISNFYFKKDIKPIELSKTFRLVADKSFPAVVVIHNIQDIHELRARMMRERYGMRSNSESNEEPEYKMVGLGSGFIVEQDGYIITNEHVVRNAKYLRVKLIDGRIFDNQLDPKSIQVVGLDRYSDLAVLKINTINLPTLKLANSDEVNIGEWVIAVGAPFGIEHTLTVGVVSQVNRHNMYKEKVFENYIQTDASINPGNSGGPLLNLRGEVVGVNSNLVSGSPYTNGSVGIGFAISSNITQRIMKQLIKYGHVHRVWLGITMENKGGVTIVSIALDSPALRSDLKVGDVITNINGLPCKRIYDIQRVMANYTFNKSVRLVVKRGNIYKIIYVNATVREGGNLGIDDDHTKKANDPTEN